MKIAGKVDNNWSRQKIYISFFVIRGLGIQTFLSRPISNETNSFFNQLDSPSVKLNNILINYVCKLTDSIW